jgi:hypothetical protein
LAVRSAGSLRSIVGRIGRPSGLECRSAFVSGGQRAASVCCGVSVRAKRRWRSSRSRCACRTAVLAAWGRQRAAVSRRARSSAPRRPARVDQVRKASKSGIRSLRRVGLPSQETVLTRSSSGWPLRASKAQKGGCLQRGAEALLPHLPVGQERRRSIGTYISRSHDACLAHHHHELLAVHRLLRAVSGVTSLLGAKRLRHQRLPRPCPPPGQRAPPLHLPPVCPRRRNRARFRRGQGRAGGGDCGSRADGRGSVTAAETQSRRPDFSAKSGKRVQRALAQGGRWVYCRRCADHGARLG